MAIAFGTFAEANAVATTVSTASITVSGSDTIGFAGSYNESGDVSGVTWNGSAMTQIQTEQNAGGGYVSLWYIIAPTTGVVTSTKATSGNHRVYAAYYTGASQTGQPDASAIDSNSPAVTELISDLTTVADNCWMVMVARCNGGDVVASTNATKRSAAHASGFFDTNAAQTPAGAKTMRITFPVSDIARSVIVSFKPVSVATTIRPIPTLLMMGVG